LKIKSAREIFQRHLEVKKELWGGEFWEDGYSVRKVGDEVAEEIIKKYIEYHQKHETSPHQSKLF